jgi:threonine dehydrogenase-like Zn-dependent dehydrogenase
MRAIRYIAGGVAVVNVPEPIGQGARVRVRSVGICGSDLAMVAATKSQVYLKTGRLSRLRP